jgi:hypothetical protein
MNASGNWEVTDRPDRSNPHEKGNRRTGQEVDGHQYGGLTAIATYALLASGESPQNEKLKRAIEFLKKTQMTGTYALGMRLQVWLFLPQTPEIRQLAKKDAAALRDMIHTKGDEKGFYDYITAKAGGSYSLSRSQYAVLGMWAAEQMGVEIDRGYWSLVEGAWIKHQSPEGAWQYKVGSEREYPYTVGITAVGVATLFITQDYLHADKAVGCNGNVNNQAIDRGMNWIAQHFDRVATDKQFDREYPYAILYAIERIGVASGHKYIAGEDWYRKGAEFLVAEQRKDGSWFGGARFIGTLPDTCFALLFLSRGRAPVAMNKLDWSTDGKGAWNQRPRDVANLARWIGHWLERDVNWQVVNLSIDPAELHDAPILYISGSRELTLSEAQAAKIRQYIEQGGMVVAHADCGAAGFVNSVKKLASTWFPQYEMRPLPETHPIYTNQQFRRDKMRQKPTLVGVSNGARELLVLIDRGDPGRAWQKAEFQSREEQFQIGANLVQYAVDKQNLRYKGVSHIVRRDGKIKPSKTIRVARLKYAGNWNPEPGGWRRLADVMHNAGTMLEVAEVDLAAGPIAGERIAHLTGTGKLSLDETSKTNLAQFIRQGGTLIVDACGGDTEFAASAEVELAALLGGKFEPLPPGHAAWGEGGLPPARWREFAMKNGASGDAPQLRGLVVDGRVACVLSPYDLSVGLVGQPVDGIIGYTPDTATALMSKILSSIK